MVDLYPIADRLGDVGLALTVFLSVLSYDATKGAVKWISLISKILKDIANNKKS